MARFEDIREIDPKLDGTGLRVGVVMARFNIDVCEGLLSACTAVAPSAAGAGQAAEVCD